MCMRKKSGTVNNEREARTEKVRISSIGINVNMASFDEACTLNRYA